MHRAAFSLDSPPDFRPRLDGSDTFNLARTNGAAFAAVILNAFRHIKPIELLQNK
jgi:hypothetical protein